MDGVTGHWQPPKMEGSVEVVFARSDLSCKFACSASPEADGAAMQQVADWLEKLGLGQHAQRFAENDISFSVLPDLTDQDLKIIGVSLGHRRRLLREIAALDKTALPMQHVPANLARRQSPQGNLIARWPRRVVHETTSARARPTSNQTR
jgi:hypothetical protein